MNGGRPTGKAENLTVVGKSIVLRIWDPRHITALWDSTACYKDSLTLDLPVQGMKCADVLPITHTPAGTRPLRLSTRRWADNSEMANCKATDLSRRPLFCEVGLQDPYRSCKDARDTLNTDCCVHFGRQIQFCSLTLVCRLCAMTNE